MSEDPVASSINIPELFALVVSLLAEKHRTLNAEERDELFEKVRDYSARLAEQNSSLAADGAALGHIAFCSYLLALYRELGLYLEDRLVRIDILRTAMADVFGRGIQTYIKGRFDVDRDEPAGAYQAVLSTFKARGEKFFGDAFVYDQETNGDSETTFGVRKCLFKDYFSRNDATELLPLFCAMDTVWSQEMNTGPYNVRFDRPTIMSVGDDKCRFRFRRVDAEPA